MNFAAMSTGSEVVAIGAASVQSVTPLQGGSAHLYMLSSTANCWFKQGVSPTASAASGSTYLPAGIPMLVAGEMGTVLAFIQEGAATGKVSITRLLA